MSQALQQKKSKKEYKAKSDGTDRSSVFVSQKGTLMKRSEVREHIFRILFCVEFCEKEEFEDQVELYFHGHEDVYKRQSWAKSKKSVLKTVKNAGNLTKSYDPDFALIEEIDLNSTRSYHVNEYSILKKCLKNYDTVFAQNYDSAFLFYPFTQPHGSSKAGLALFSRYPIKDSLRRSLPISTSYNQFFDLDRCYSI